MSSLAYPLGIAPTATSLDDPTKRSALAAMDTVGAAPALPVVAPPPAPVATPAAPAPNLPPAPSVVPTANRLAANPQLVAHPVNQADPGVYDAQYEAEQAQLAAEISNRYNDVLKNLGYIDPSSGQFVMGRVEAEANRQRPELNRSMGLAAEEQTKQRQLEGTLFSGRRGTEEARAQHPFVQSLADLDVNVPLQLSDLYEQGAGLMGEYTRRQNLMLIDAARRRAAGLATTAYPDAAAPAATPGVDTTIPDPTIADPNALPPGQIDPLIYYGRNEPGVM